MHGRTLALTCSALAPHFWQGAHAYDWVAGLFDGARRTAGRTRDHLARYIAVVVVFGELRDVVYERLYRFHVQVGAGRLCVAIGCKWRGHQQGPVGRPTAHASQPTVLWPAYLPAC